MRKIILKSIVFLAMILAFSSIVYWGLMSGYRTLYYDDAEYIRLVFGEIGAFPYFVSVSVLFILTLFFGELFLYKKFKQVQYSTEKKVSITLLPKLFFLMYFSAVMLTIGMYLIIKPYPSEGLFEMFLIYFVGIFIPIFLGLYSLIRFTFFYLAVKKDYLTGTLIGFADLYFKKIMVVLISLIAISGIIFSFDQVTNGKYLKITFNQKAKKIADTANYKIFRIFKDYSKDSKYVYYQDKIIEGADPQTFEVLSYQISKDKNFVYKYRTPLHNIADPQTFVLLKKEKTGFDSSFAKDKEKVYLEKTGYGKFYPIEGADPTSFVVTEGGDGKDKYRTYLPHIIRESIDFKFYNF